MLILPYKYSFGTVIFPNLILEAFAVGIPVLTTDLEPIKEIIIDKTTGFIAKRKSPDDLADKILEIVSLPDEQSETIIKNQRAAIQNKYNPANIASGYIELYSEALNSFEKKRN